MTSGRGPRRATAYLGVAVALSLVGCAPTGGEPIELSTHCGIEWLSHEGEWFVRVGGLLDDGAGNAPPGWADPVQSGWVERPDEASAVFTDAEGHREEFRRSGEGPGLTDGCD